MKDAKMLAVLSMVTIDKIWRNISEAHCDKYTKRDYGRKII